MLEKGFILTSNYFDRPDGIEIVLEGVSTSGPFRIVLNQEKAVFFVEEKSQANSNLAIEKKSLPLKNANGESMCGLYFKNFQTAQEARDKIESEGHRTYEADIRPHERFLMERFIFGCIEFEGAYDQNLGLRSYVNPNIRKSFYKASKFKVLSFDIETGVDGTVYSVGLHAYNTDGSGKEFKNVIMRSDEDRIAHDNLQYVSSEKQLLISFLEQFNEIDPDFIIGWNVVGFDLKFLDKRYQEFSIPFNLGRGNKAFQFDDRKGIGSFARIPGRVVIDGPPAMRSSFYQFENFKLETVAQEILGVGKDIASDGGKVEEIERRFREDKEALAHYNLLDCTLVSEIYQKTGLIDLFVKRSIISGLQIDRVGMSSAAFDHVYLPLFHRAGRVAPNTRDLNREFSSGGGHVVTPEAGLFKNVIVLDFKSLYPSIIRTFNIDPLSLIEAKNDPLSNPSGVDFSSSKHLLPEKIGELLELRAKAKEAGDKHLSQAIKILMNSFYGVMGSSRCRFYHSDLPHAITSIGQWVIKTSIQFFENRDIKVIYGDTDSVFVELKDTESSKVDEIAEKLAQEVTDYLSTLIKTDYSARSHLFMEYEKSYQKFFIPKARGTDEGAKKRYVGFNRDKEGDHLDFVGMEYVRSDWTKLAKNFQYELMRKVFTGEDYQQWIAGFCKEVEDGKYDDQLVYKKRISKKLEEYTKNIPPHIRAARLIDHKGPYRLKQVQYVMTRQGPIPIQNEIKDIDYQHYIEKQVGPLADSILLTFGENFDSLREGSQLNLFDF